MARDKSLPLEKRGSLTFTEAKSYAGVGDRKAHALIKSGAWRCYRNGREYRVIKKSLDDWMDAEAEAFRRQEAA